MKYFVGVFAALAIVGAIHCQASNSQDKKFPDLFDQSIVERQHLAESLAVKYSLILTEQGRVRVRAGRTERGYAESLMTTEELGVILKGKDGKKEVSHSLQTVVTVQTWEDSDFDRNDESSSALHVLKHQDKAWIGFGKAKFGVNEIEGTKTPKSLSNFPFEVLPYCDLYPFISHGGGIDNTFDRFSTADVVHDRRTQDGKREILILYASRKGAVRIVIPNFTNWQAETVQSFVCDMEPRGKLDDPELEEKILKTWRNSATVEVTWGVAYLDGERVAVPSKVMMNAISPGRERLYTVEGVFIDWRLGNQVDEKEFSLEKFKESGEGGVDFIEIKRKRSICPC